MNEVTKSSTGAASGVGIAIVELYAKEGAKVVVADLNGDAIFEVVDSIILAGGTAVGDHEDIQGRDGSSA